MSEERERETTVAHWMQLPAPLDNIEMICGRRADDPSLKHDRVAIEKDKVTCPACLVMLGQYRVVPRIDGAQVKEATVVDGQLVVSVSGGATTLLGAQLAACLIESGAPNYIEMTFDPRLGDERRSIIVRIQWADGLSPDQARKAAEAELEVARESFAKLDQAAREQTEQIEALEDALATHCARLEQLEAELLSAQQHVEDLSAELKENRVPE